MYLYVSVSVCMYDHDNDNDKDKDSNHNHACMNSIPYERTRILQALRDWIASIKSPFIDLINGI